MENDINKLIEEIKIVKQTSEEDVDITIEYEVCGSHTRYADN